MKANNYDMMKRIETLEEKTEDSGWININVLAGTAATGYYTPQYRKIGNRVDMRGYISEIGEEGTLVFTLPERI